MVLSLKLGTENKPKTSIEMRANLQVHKGCPSRFCFQVLLPRFRASPLLAERASSSQVSEYLGCKQTRGDDAKLEALKHERH